MRHCCGSKSRSCGSENQQWLKLNSIPTRGFPEQWRNLDDSIREVLLIETFERSLFNGILIRCGTEKWLSHNSWKRKTIEEEQKTQISWEIARRGPENSGVGNEKDCRAVKSFNSLLRNSESHQTSQNSTKRSGLETTIKFIYFHYLC